MALDTVARIGEIPTLEILVADLEIADLETTLLYESEAADSEYLPACERHWAIREAINATPARTLPELRAKSRAAEIALELDAEADCEGPGSFVELARSLISDLTATGSPRYPLYVKVDQPIEAVQ
jgi:hypothetical protein